MLDGWVQTIIKKLLSNGTIQEENKALYVYGLKQGIMMIMNCIVALLIGLAFGMLMNSLLFLVFYVPLRSYAGGYHARTQVKCNIYSALLIVVYLFVLKFIPLISGLHLIIGLVSSILILALAPVGDINKPLDETEMRVYKKRLRIILFIEVSILSLFVILEFNKAAMGIALALALLVCMLVLGRIINIKYHRKVVEHNT